MQVEIPGGMATLRDKVGWEGRQLLQSHVRGASDAIRKIYVAQREGAASATETAIRARLTTEESLGLALFQRAAVVAFLRTWSLDQPVPRTMDDFADVDPDVGEALAKATFPLAMTGMRSAKPNDASSGMNEDGTRDLDSPTGPSTGSEHGERAEASTSGDPSTTTSPSDTTGIASGAAFPV